MTYEEALETWARRRWADIPKGATRFSLEAYYPSLGCDDNDRYYVTFWFEDNQRGSRDIEAQIDVLTREIVNTALGATE